MSDNLAKQIPPAFPEDLAEAVKATFPTLCLITEKQGSPAYATKHAFTGTWLGEENPVYVYSFLRDSDLTETSRVSFTFGEEAVIEIRGHSARLVWSDGSESVAERLTRHSTRPESGIRIGDFWYVFQWGRSDV
jgi:hypothetical protein